jgi:cell division protein ZapA (FtsZ GTPase activity inhibitor)
MHSVEVQILGQSYSVKTDQDAEYIKKKQTKMQNT